VIFYGHGESATDRARHLLALRDLQQVTGGFTELVPMAMPHAADDDHRSVHAVARLLLRGHIDHIQAAWTRLGAEGTVLALRSGADDLGGTLLDGNCYPEAGVEYGKEMTVERAHGVARSLGRQLRQRTTTYAIPRGATW
jgi:FO synthase